jgi:hypothetical protein
MRLRSRALPPILLILSSCGFVHDESIDGPYRVVAVDIDSQMDVCYQIPDGCVGRIPETVFAVGSDAKYIVAARHPNSDRSKTEYYYLIRALDSPVADPSASVRGPFSAEAFSGERVKLALPQLTREISSVK